jgi:radical SAM protein with 4Fe4S-binding SPASM domain
MAIQQNFDFLIQWHLTERCNLQCSHCYQTGSVGPELSFEEVRQGLDEVREMFDAWTCSYGLSLSPSFNITGGEPLLREDLLPVLEAVRERGWPSFLLTNGTLVDRRKARLLRDAGIEGVQVSIEGCDEVHDAIRGRGSFDRATEGVEHLLDAGHTVTLNVTLSRLNAGVMRKVVRFASHLGVQRLGFSRLVPAGRGIGLTSQMLPAGEVKELYSSLFDMNIANLEIVTGDPLAARLRADSMQQRNGKVGRKRSDGIAAGGCSAGIAGLTILADGTIVPCRRLPLPLGNIRTESLREIWAVSPVLEALRDKSRYRGRCGTCERWDLCRGCRAIAYAAAGAQGEDDSLAEDPQCFLFEAVRPSEEPSLESRGRYR